jgi:hypothetical protein
MFTCFHGVGVVYCNCATGDAEHGRHTRRNPVLRGSGAEADQVGHSVITSIELDGSVVVPETLRLVRVGAMFLSFCSLKSPEFKTKKFSPRLIENTVRLDAVNVL